MMEKGAGTQSAQGPRAWGRVRASWSIFGASRSGFRTGLGGIALACAIGMGLSGPAHGEPAWRELQEPVRGASYGETGGTPLFVLGCGTGPGGFIQAPLPAGTRLRAGRNAALPIVVDGKAFSLNGRIAVDDTAEGGPRGAVVASVRFTDPLVKALFGGKELQFGKGEAAVVIPLDTGTALLDRAAETCGAPTAGTSRPQAEAAAPAATARPEPAANAAAKPARTGGVPPAREIAAAIFVDQEEGQRVADKLKITPVDLNGDGAPEAIITLNDPTWCGQTGCTWFVVDLSGKPRVMGQFIGQGLAPSKGSNDGWRDLSLKTPAGSERMYYRDGTYH